MKISTRIIFTTLISLALSINALAQGKMYTRKALLEDFPRKTVKVLATGSSLLEMSLREEFSSRWRLSPYELCTPAEYEELRQSNDYYFLYIACDGDVAFLVLNKGGKDDESDNFKKPFEIIRVPFANFNEPTGSEVVLIGAFVEMLQNFVQDAMNSERNAYIGLSIYNNRKMEGRTLYLDSEEPEAIYQSGLSNSLIGLTIRPSAPADKAYCYRMVFAPDTHELYYFRKASYKTEADAAFTKGEIKQFIKKNAILP